MVAKPNSARTADVRSNLGMSFPLESGGPLTIARRMNVAKAGTWRTPRDKRARTQDRRRRAIAGLGHRVAGLYQSNALERGRRRMNV